jgi:hypothetical protein
MLHIHNGGSTAGTMKESGFPGEHFAFMEALATGPTPQGLSKDDWAGTRAEYLAEDSEADAITIKRDFATNDATLANAGKHEEIILWFEHDLFCQINLVYLLDRFARQGSGGARLSLICIGEFPGITDFRGLGQLTGQQMASLFDTRHAVTEAELNLAQKAWAAYCAPAPDGLERLIAEDTSAMPFLRGALEQHLARFPSVRNGLGRAENRLLNFISKGVAGFSPLCQTFFKDQPAYGLGDTQIWRDLNRIAGSPRPLIRIEGLDGSANSHMRSSCALTEIGSRVLAGEEDFVALNGIDQWLGGVHLRNDNLWRWDDQRMTLTQAAA